jgi:hypothetical protein
MSETPNVVIESPAVRRVLVLILGIVAIITACAAIILGFWPELSGLKPDPTRIIATINALVSFLSGAFGLGVTLPNIPKSVGGKGTAPADTPDEADGYDPALPEPVAEVDVDGKRYVGELPAETESDAL